MFWYWNDRLPVKSHFSLADRMVTKTNTSIIVPISNCSVSGFDVQRSSRIRVSSCQFIWGLLWQKQVSRAGASNYTSQILWGVIACPCPWYMFLTTNAKHWVCRIIYFNWSSSLVRIAMENLSNWLFHVGIQRLNVITTTAFNSPCDDTFVSVATYAFQWPQSWYKREISKYRADCQRLSCGFGSFK